MLDGGESQNSQAVRRKAIISALQAAKHVLPMFEEQFPSDDRPRNAIKAGHDWYEGRVTMQVARVAAFGSHAAARLTVNPAACAAARSAAHAAATAHVVGHADAAIKYAALAQRIAGKEVCK